MGSGHARCDGSDPHANQALVTAGPRPEEALGTVIFLHGRGDFAENILSLGNAMGIAELAGVAPQAAGHTWYPNSFLAPVESNQPYLDSGLKRIEAIVADLLSRGVPSERIAVLGFSQGACLACEFAARHPRKYGAIIALTGGLIGPPGSLKKHRGSLEGTPVFLGTSDPDPHVPPERVKETEIELRRMGGEVVMISYPGLPHTINQDELGIARQMLQRMIGQNPPTR